MSTTSTHTIELEAIGPVQVTTSERGEGHTFMLLHGGAGPQSVTVFADQFAATKPARIVTPVHPGFAGTPRPEGLNTVRGLAALYLGLLDELDLTDVTVIGNSIGGWIAAEMAALGSTRLGSVIIVDAAGLDVPGHPVTDIFSLTLDEIAEYSYHDPDSFRIDLSGLTPEQLAIGAGNRKALAVYGGATMTDPSLAARLAEITVPSLVVWGESDRIVDPEHGRVFAAAIPGAEFQLLPATGHVPQVESPEQFVNTIWDFTTAHAPASVD